MLSEAFPPEERQHGDMHSHSPPVPASSPPPATSSTDASPACPHLLRRPDLGVRPPGEPLPAPLRASDGALAQVFGRWLRQRDDPAHAVEKAALRRALAAVPDDAVRREARRQAAIAWPGGATHWTWAVPAATTAALLGLPMTSVAHQRELHAALRAMAGGLDAQADGAAAGAADAAVMRLLDALRTSERDAPDAPLQWALLHHAGPAEWPDRASFAANRLALLWQSHEAGAALLGHGLLGHELIGNGRFGNGLLDAAPTREALRQLAGSGGGVRLTRRFALRDINEPGLSLRRGEGVVVPLTGPDEAFGLGAHRCPGESLALSTIAAALQWRADQPALQVPVPSEPLRLPNMEIPQFQSPSPESGSLVFDPTQSSSQETPS